MPSYFDETTKTWFCKFYYQDYTGSRKQKKKRGFKLQREAKEWERSFLERQQGSPDMTFQALYDLYIEDMSSRLKASSISGKKYLFDNKILPTFKDKPINKITAPDIRKWQNKQIDAGYADSYLDRMNNAIVTIFNYAVTFYNLPANPCKAAGKMGKRKIVVNFWTKEEYDHFISTVSEIQAHTAFEILYYSGIRFGELLALTLKDIDFDKNTISISKSLQRINKQDVVTTPKTPKSTRTIAMPPFIIQELRNYTDKVYGISPEERIFPFTKSLIGNAMKRGCQKSNVKLIRIHDIRHSHASLLIELGFSPLLISERLGHEKVDTTLTTYAHLYPNKHNEVSDKLQLLYSENSTKSVPTTA